MLHKVFTNDKVKYLLNKEFFRFLIVGGTNTAIGYSITLFLFYVVKLDYMVSQVLNYVICFPLAYTLQVKYAFHTHWSMKRMFAYPLSSLPNFAIQLVTLALSVEIFKLPEYIAYLASYIIPIPIMFFVVRLLVVNCKDSQKGQR